VTFFCGENSPLCEKKKKKCPATCWSRKLLENFPIKLSHFEEKMSEFTNVFGEVEQISSFVILKWPYFRSYVLLVCQHVVENLNFQPIYLFCNHISPNLCLPLLVQHDKIEKKNTGLQPEPNATMHVHLCLWLRLFAFTWAAMTQHLPMHQLMDEDERRPKQPFLFFFLFLPHLAS
jgi:hypothetical protein